MGAGAGPLHSNRRDVQSVSKQMNLHATSGKVELVANSGWDG